VPARRKAADTDAADATDEIASVDAEPTGGVPTVSEPPTPRAPATRTAKPRRPAGTAASDEPAPQDATAKKTPRPRRAAPTAAAPTVAESARTDAAPEPVAPDSTTAPVEPTTAEYRDELREGRVRVTLVRSTIGHRAGARGTVRALGLHRLHQSVEIDDTPQNRGMLRRIAFLVDVREPAASPEGPDR
jgi:large subunit ribosomal protein L30